jgi:hypothetical protein
MERGDRVAVDSADEGACLWVGGAGFAAPPGEKLSANENEVNFMKGFKARKVLSALLMAVVMAMFVCGAAFAAPGDIVGLVDFNTTQTQRPNTFDSNLRGDYFEFNIVLSVETSTPGEYAPQFFSSAAEADPANFDWSQLSSLTGGTDVDLGTAAAMETAPSSGLWYYYVVAYAYGGYTGPENWHAEYSYGSVVTSGDFTITTTDFLNQDPGTTEANIQVEFYNGSAAVPANLIASGLYPLVYGYDDYANPPAIGRSYSTALDAVGRAFEAKDIDSYAKPSKGVGTMQMLDSITKNGITYPQAPVAYYGWMYAVYYSDNGVTYTRDDDDTYIFGPDDYMFKAALKQRYTARVVWAWGRLIDYDTYLPPTLP